MLIKALCDYYDILSSAGKVLPEGYSSVKVHYVISLTEDGIVDEIIDCQKTEQYQDKKNNVKEFIGRNKRKIDTPPTIPPNTNLLNFTPLLRRKETDKSSKKSKAKFKKNSTSIYTFISSPNSSIKKRHR